MDVAARLVADTSHSDVLDGSAETSMAVALAVRENKQSVGVHDIAAQLNGRQPLDIGLPGMQVLVMFARRPHNPGADDFGRVAKADVGPHVHLDRHPPVLEPGGEIRTLQQAAELGRQRCITVDAVYVC